MQHLLFFNLGKTSAYKCITKSFSYEHITDYLAMNLIKFRMLELVYLTCQETTAAQSRSKPTARDAV